MPCRARSRAATPPRARSLVLPCRKAGIPARSCAFRAFATSEGTYEARYRLIACPMFTERPGHEHEGTESRRRNACRRALRGRSIGPGRHHFARLRLCAGLRLCAPGLCGAGARLWGARSIRHGCDIPAGCDLRRSGAPGADSAARLCLCGTGAHVRARLCGGNRLRLCGFRLRLRPDQELRGAGLCLRPDQELRGAELCLDRDPGVPARQLRGPPLPLALIAQSAYASELAPPRAGPILWERPRKARAEMAE